MNVNEIITDGLTDNTEDLQYLIDNAEHELELPMPKVCYLISKPLTLHSYFKLKLPRYAEIKLATKADCPMIEVKGDVKKEIAVEGGIWNYNNLNQHANPYKFPDPECTKKDYRGVIMEFTNVVGFRIENLTFKDPVTFAITLDTVSYFQVENIRFDYNYGNPWAFNMDGIHVNGNCHFGHIQNLFGACYDDLVALNADEGSSGPITNIEVNGIYSEDCHSAVRMLAVKQKLRGIHIHDVYGTYFQYCIGLTKYYRGETTGYFEGITLNNIFASKAERRYEYHKEGTYVFPLIWIEEETWVKSLTINNLYRHEYITESETIFIGKGAEVDYLDIVNVHIEGKADQCKAPVIRNRGKINTLYYNKFTYDRERTVLENSGEIKNISTDVKDR